MKSIITKDKLQRYNTKFEEKYIDDMLKDIATLKEQINTINTKLEKAVYFEEIEVIDEK